MVSSLTPEVVCWGLRNAHTPRHWLSSGPLSIAFPAGLVSLQCLESVNTMPAPPRLPVRMACGGPAGDFIPDAAQRSYTSTCVSPFPNGFSSRAL